MKAALPLAILMAFLTAAGAETPAKDAVVPGMWVLPGHYFKEVRDVKILNPVTVSFSHSAGKTTVRFEKIEEKFRVAFGYDKAKADAYEADLAAKDAERKRIAAEIAEKEKLLAEKLAEREKLDKEIAEEKQRKLAKQNGIAAVQRSTYGTRRYWAQDNIGRELADAGMAAFLRGQGFTNDEAWKILERYKYREDF